MDVRGNAAVVCTAPHPQQSGGNKSFYYVYDLRNPQGGPTRPPVESPLKFQSRAVRIFADEQLFVVSSIEGRCAIKPLDASKETCNCRNNNHNYGCPQKQPLLQGEADQQRLLAFNFRCHRSDSNNSPLYVYPVNAIDCHPDGQNFAPVFATAGSDGVVSVWNRRERAKLTDRDGFALRGPAIGTEETTAKSGQKVPFQYYQSVTDVKFSPDGAQIAYACSYDWHKGAEHHKAEHVPSIYVKGLTPQNLTSKRT
jgi:mRNA export factor